MIAGRRLTARLHSGFAPVVNLWLDYLEEQGVDISITSGYRSIEDQKRVCAVTSGPCATPGRSAHQFGLALDFVAGGSVNSADHKYAMEVAGALGFAFVRNDPVHIQHPAWEQLRQKLRRV